jgi:uncharacterized protein
MEDLNPVEKTICLSKELAELDSETAEAYGSKTGTLKGTAKEKFRAEEKVFIKTRDFCQKDESCLIKAYKTRLAELKKI